MAHLRTAHRGVVRKLPPSETLANESSRPRAGGDPRHAHDGYSSTVSITSYTPDTGWLSTKAER